jgi:hypothetical protein
MNRALRRGMNKKHGLHGSINRRRGGGYSAQGTLFPIDQKPGGDWDNQTGLGQYAVTNPYSDCSWTSRPGELYNKVTNESLASAQAPMAGGRRSTRRVRGGGSCGAPRMYGGGSCGAPRMYGGTCGCAPAFTGLPRRNNAPYSGGRRKTRRHRGGGTYGYSIDPSQSIGGNGPNVDALRVPVPCDGRMGTQHALNPQVVEGPDPRAPADLYSLAPPGSTAGVTGYEEGTLNPAFMKGGRRRSMRRARRRVGGSYGTPNAYPEECYRATGSSLPVYNASTAGFTFSPSTDKGVFLPDGITAYNEVWPVAARVGPANGPSPTAGGGRRKNHSSRRHRKNHSSRKNAKKNKRSRKH